MLGASLSERGVGPMIVICPACRAPSNIHEAECWVCYRVFDGSEPVIGETPGARKPLQVADVREWTHTRRVEEPRWQQAGSF